MLRGVIALQQADKRKSLAGVSACDSRVGFVLATAVPYYDTSRFSGFVHIYYALIQRAAEAETEALFLLDKPSVDENINVGKKLPRYGKTLFVSAYLAAQLLVEIARKEPYVLFGIVFLHLT